MNRLGLCFMPGPHRLAQAAAGAISNVGEMRLCGERRTSRRRRTRRELAEPMRAYRTGGGEGAGLPALAGPTRRRPSWHPEAHFDLGSSNIVLYGGASPSGQWQDIANTGLKPVTRLLQRDHRRAEPCVREASICLARGLYHAPPQGKADRHRRLRLAADVYPRVGAERHAAVAGGWMARTPLPWDAYRWMLLAVDLTPCPRRPGIMKRAGRAVVGKEILKSVDLTAWRQQAATVGYRADAAPRRRGCQCDPVTYSGAGSLRLVFRDLHPQHFASARDRSLFHQLPPHHSRRELPRSPTTGAAPNSCCHFPERLLMLCRNSYRRRLVQT